LKIETQILEDHQAKLTVDVEAEQMEGMKRRAARKIANRVRIPGFRPGKVPYQVIARHVGEAALLEEAIELLVDDIYPTILEESKIEPYGPGRLENIVSKDPLKLEFLVPMKAEVDLGDYRSLRRPYQPTEIIEQDVQETLQNLRENQAIIEPVDRAAQEGDLVTVRLSARRTQVEEGKEPVFIRESSFPFVVHPAPSTKDQDQEIDKPSNEWPFPGFSQNLVGLSENDEKTLHYVFAEDAELETMRGEEGEFHLNVVNVKSRKLPDLDDDFAVSLGDYENIDDLRQKVRTALEKQAKEAYDKSYDEGIMKAAIEQATFKYPPQMLERELEEVVDDLRHRLEQQKYSMDLYLKTRNLEMDGLKEEMRPIAEERIRNQLFLIELSNLEKINIEPDELQGEAQNTMDYLQRMLPKKEARRLSEREVFSNLVNNIYVNMITQRAIERFRNICSGKIEQEKDTSEIAEGEETATGDQNSKIIDNPPQAEEEIVTKNNNEGS
jgi:trigger factor